MSCTAHAHCYIQQLQKLIQIFQIFSTLLRQGRNPESEQTIIMDRENKTNGESFPISRTP